MERAHFNHAGMSVTPRSVVAAMRAHLDLEDELGGYEAAAAATDAIDRVPQQLARLIGATADEVCATESASRAWELALWPTADALDLSVGDRIIIDQFSYATVYSSLVRLASARGVEIVVAPALDDGSVDPERLIELIDDRTRIIVVTHMPTHLGTVTDVADIGRRLEGSDAVYVVDVSQTVGQRRVDVTEIGCDVAFAPGRKFLRAPRSTGLLYVRQSLADRLVPLVPPFGSVDPASPGSFDLPTGMRRFDLFEYAVAARLGLGEAARLAVEIGLDRIAGEMAVRSRQVIDLLDSIRGIERTGTDSDVGIISFVHRDHDATDVQEQLASQGVNVWINTAGGAPVDAAVRGRFPTVRVSPHHVTTDDDIDRLDRALRSLT